MQVMLGSAISCRMLATAAALGLIACATGSNQNSEEGPKIAFTLTGKVKLQTSALTATGSVTVPDESFGGDLSGVLYSSTEDGFCQRGLDRFMYAGLGLAKSVDVATAK